MSGAEDEGAVTHDSLLRGRIKLIQPARGFRSSLDPVLLAGFIRPPFGHFLDIGCGTGAVSFLLLALDPASSGVAVEIQARLARLTGQGVEANDFASRLRVVAEDVRKTQEIPSAAFDLVATNPPFRPLGTGNLPPHNERSLAHHEVTLTLANWLDVARAALRPEGRLCAILPADRLNDVRTGLRQRGMAMARLRMVAAQPDATPLRCCFEARAASLVATTQEEPTLIVHEAGGYSAEVRRMLGEEV
jgi:tRNA1Val (adenine37-N6)-methyltransferase